MSSRMPCPSARRRGTAALHQLQYPLTLRHWSQRHRTLCWQVRLIADRPPIERFVWHLSACNNANTSPCHTRHAPQIAPQSESLQTHAHMRARAFYCRLTHDADALAFATYAADGAIDANAHVPAPPPTV